MSDCDAKIRKDVPAAAPDSARAFVEFARRLANFGLGEIDDPKLAELRPRLTGPTLMP